MPPSKAAARDALNHPALTESVRALAQRGELRSYRKGTLLIQEGDVGDTIYVILSGRLRAFGSNPGGDREITYGSYGPGEYIGEMGLDGGPRSASVLALEPTVCAVIARPTLQAHIAERPEFAFELLAKVIRRARDATLSAKRMALNDVYGRLKQLLESMAERQADGTNHIASLPTHIDMAGRIGCTREMVSRVMKDLRHGGNVKVVSGRSIVFRVAADALVTAIAAAVATGAESVCWRVAGLANARWRAAAAHRRQPVRVAGDGGPNLRSGFSALA